MLKSTNNSVLSFNVARKVKMNDANSKVIKIRPQINVLSSVRFILLMGQCFALLPIDGVLSNEVTNLKFSWKSYKSFYSIIYFISTTFILLINTIYFFQFGFTLSQYGEFF